MYTIEDLKNGKCAVINDGSFDELSKVLELAFPEDMYNGSNAFSYGLFYFQDENAKSKWLF